MFKPVAVNIAEIYVPSDRRKELDPEKVEAIAAQIMAEEDVSPIHVRQGKGRYVLVKGVNRLEARKMLGDTTVQAYVVRAKQH